MSLIPRDPQIDSTISLWKEGYEFIWNRCRAYGSDIFLTRIMGQQAICIHGREAAELFYDESKVQRTGAVPRRVTASLGKSSVHTLDGDAHRERKQAFLALMSPASIERLMDETARQWRIAIRSWEHADAVVLFDEVERVLTRAVCAWAEVPLEPEDVPRRARDFGRMVDAFGGVGPRLWRGKLARGRTERWITPIVEDARRSPRGDPRSPLRIMAGLRGEDGGPLDARTAAVELINVLRPTVAVSWYIAFAALALHQHPEASARMACEPIGAGEYADLFTQEVRRFYPFTPYLAAKVRTPFEWRGQRFEPGHLVLLDVYGASRDPSLWGAPDEFRPERFRRWNGGAFDFIPQGGGDRLGHRCPGEWITMHNVALALHFLTRCMRYWVTPGQDLRVDLTRMPARPGSGFVMQEVRALPALEGKAPRLPSLAAARGSAAAAGVGRAGVDGDGSPHPSRRNRGAAL